MATTEISKFGDGTLVGSGGNVTSNVHNVFGPRNSGGTTGVNRVSGITEELIIDVTGEFFNDVANTLVDYTLPAGAIVKAVYIDVEEVFVVTGTSPTLLIGTDGSEVTNGFVVTEAQLEATATVNLTSTLTGTWDAEAPLAADTIVGLALGGTSPVVTDVGKARVTIVYDRANRTL